MIISPFNPIRFFKEDSGAPCPGISGCVRTFAESDLIMLQFFHMIEEDPGTLELYDGITGELIAPLALRQFNTNQEETLSLCEMSGLVEGHYFMRIGDCISECVQIKADHKVDDTVLIQYAYRNNRDRNDVYNRLFGGIRYFSLRVQGGFKDSGWLFKVDNEQFCTSNADTVELFAIDYTDKVLTLGTSSGIDYMTAELINRIFTCPLVFVDGTRYARSDGSVLERDGEPDKKKLVYSILLREAHYLDAEMELAIRLNLRRTPSTIRSARGQLRRIR